jgi:hypothetical protein
MILGLHSDLFAIFLFVAILILLEVGRRVGKRHLARDPEGARTGVTGVEGAIFGLLGLLIAFTFSGAASRFDARRKLITDEVNATATAWLRLDLLPADAQPALRDLFRRYLDSRLETYRRIPDLAAAKAELAHSIQLQGEIWTTSLAAIRSAPSGPSGTALITALNSMFDVVRARTAAAFTHPPLIIYGMLGGLALAAAVLAGHAMAGAKAHNWFHVVGFAMVLSATVYVILDLEFPRLGYIRLDEADRALVELRESMK